MEHPKQRVFVFDKAELFFLFLFFIVMAITSFVLGMRLGKKQAELFLHPDSQSTNTALELKSKHEEEVVDKDPAATEAGAFVDKPSATGAANDMDEETFKKLQEEYQKLNANEMGAPNATPATEPAVTAPEVTGNAVTQAPNTDSAEAAQDQSFLNPDPSFIGKYTIQLGSYRTLEEAKGFAEGFLVRGYKPLVREVDVQSQGTWYRVSLGVFESISAATSYIQKESNLFGSFKKGQYFIQEIK